MNYLRVHTASGSIVSRHSFEPDVLPIMDEEHQLIEGDADPADNWFDGDQIAPRVPCDAPTASGIIESSRDAQPVVTGLPAPCWVRISGRGSIPFEQQLVHVTDGTLMSAASVPGTYVVSLIGQFVGPEITFEAVTLDQLKARRSDEVTAWKAATIAAGVEWNGHRWDAGPDDLARMRGYLGLPLPKGFYWTSFDGEDVPLDKPGLAALVEAVAGFVFMVHNHSRALKIAVQSAPSIYATASVTIRAKEMR